MARTPFATDHYDTPQKSVRIPPNSVGYIVIHHTAGGTYQGVIALEMGLRQVSSTVIIADANCASMMDEYYRAWSLSSQYWDSVSLSSETVNSGGAAEGWPISEASYETLAKVVADWCQRYSIPCNRTYIMGHREVYTRYGASYATACPGGIDLDRVVVDANNIINSGSISKRKRTDMSMHYLKKSTLTNGNRTANTLVALAGEGGTNWIEFLNGPDDKLAGLFQARGVSAMSLSDAEWDKFKKDYTAPVQVSGGGSGGGGLTTAQDAKLMSVPTAEQNGAAARAAIVK